MLTVPLLFAGATSDGPHRCFYCGAKCGAEFPASRYVKGSFTGLDGVAAPGSPAVCPGCVACLSEDATIRMIDGTTRERQKVRCYSWVLAGGQSLAASKSHRSAVEAVCVTPPMPPFAICLSESGQKHLLYRGVVNYDRAAVTATIETWSVTYRPEELSKRLFLVRRLTAVTGKPAVQSGLSITHEMAVVERYGESLLSEWRAVCREPLSRLALFLCPGKEFCNVDYTDSAGATS